MNASRRNAAFLLCFWLGGLASAVHAAPVTYTLQTVGDGKIGSRVFSEAVITITMHSDTSNVVTNGTLSTNAVGAAKVTIVGNGHRITAHFAPGEVFVFHDSALAIAGFGSRVSPTYPFALGCEDTPLSAATYTKDCANGNHLDFDGTLGDGTYTQSLTLSSVLTGSVHSCASLYDFNALYPGDLGACSGFPVTGLHTDRGALYFSDKIGGTTGNFGPFLWGGWDTSNRGFLRVEVRE